MPDIWGVRYTASVFIDTGDGERLCFNRGHSEPIGLFYYYKEARAWPEYQSTTGRWIPDGHDWMYRFETEADQVAADGSVVRLITEHTYTVYRSAVSDL